MTGTPRQGHAPIEMRRVASGDAIGQVGDFAWAIDALGRRAIWIAEPHVGGGWVSARITIDHRNTSGAQWSWNGDEDKPTLHPSIHSVGCWHGHVTAGKLVEA